MRGHLHICRAASTVLCDCCSVMGCGLLSYLLWMRCTECRCPCCEEVAVEMICIYNSSSSKLRPVVGRYP